MEFATGTPEIVVPTIEDDDILSSVPNMKTLLNNFFEKSSEKKVRKEVTSSAKPQEKQTRRASASSIKSTISLKKEELMKNQIKLDDLQKKTTTWLSEAPAEFAKIEARFEMRKIDLLKTQDHTEKGKKILVKYYTSMIEKYQSELDNGDYTSNDYTQEFMEEYTKILGMKKESIEKIQRDYIDISNKIISEKINGDSGLISKNSKLSQEIEALEIQLKETERLERMPVRDKDTGSTRALVNKISDSSSELDQYFDKPVSDKELSNAANSVMGMQD